MTARNYGSYCGVANALELVGERWALLIVRDLLVGPRRYTDLKAGLPRIPTNILSTRLKELQEGGVIRRAPLLRSKLYELTDYGRELDGIVLALGRWGLQGLGEPADGDIVTPDSLTMTLRSVFRADAVGSVPPTTYGVRVGEVDLAVRVDGPNLRVTPRTSTETDVSIEFEAAGGIRSLIAGDVTADVAIDRGLVTVTAGNPLLVDRFAATFSLAAHAVAS